MDKDHFQKLEVKIDAFLHCGDWASAVFWAEQLVLCNEDDAYAIYTFARCLFMAGEYGRALLYLERRQLIEGHELFRFLAAQCKLARHLPGEVISLLQHVSENSPKTKICRQKARSNLKRLSVLDELAINLNIAGQRSLLLGKALQMIEDTKEAVEAYKRALQDDIMIADAACRLFLDHFVKPSEKEEIFQSIQSCMEMQNVVNPHLVHFFYALMLGRPPIDLQESVLSKYPSLEDSSLVCFQKARDLYSAGNFDSALDELDKEVLTNEHDGRVLALRCCSLYLSGQEALLFRLAHELSLYMPDQAITYFAIGCYYFAVEGYDMAKQFFRKSAKIDSVSCYAWIAYGHACASDLEHDQAMNSYLRASTLMQGHPFPLTLIGVEYTITGHYALAQSYLSEALELAPFNPYTVHEMGVLLLKMGKYRTAETYFVRALRLIGVEERRVPIHWEPLVNNLGHCYRKMRMYDKALRQFEESLELVPCNPSTLISMAFVHMLMRDSWSAVRYLREALSINPEDSVAKRLISRALENGSVTGFTFAVTECESGSAVTSRELDHLLSCFEE
uniref:TPR_REGION domain-containing protein n=1 Tax=Trichuris muris TaxID=70415 RepID=A0A5S6Q4K6_TRIMR